MFDITNFRSSINTKGILRTNRYIVQFAKPEYLRDYDIETIKMMSLRCESVSLPGFDILSADSPPRAGYGPIEKQLYVPAFSGLSLTFLVDTKNTIYKFFYDWTMAIVNYDSQGATKLRSNSRGRAPYEVGYKNKYKTELVISVYDGNTTENTEVKTGSEIVRMKIFGAYPNGLPTIPLAWESSDLMKLQVPFSFTDFSIEFNK